MRNQSENERRSNDDGKSEDCIVPMKPGNSDGGKAAKRWWSSREAPSGLCAGTVVTTDLGARTFQPWLIRDSHRGEPDALTAHVRFWEGAQLNRPSPSFMLSLEERASSTHPKCSVDRSISDVCSLFALADCKRSDLHCSMTAVATNNNRKRCQVWRRKL